MAYRIQDVRLDSSAGPFHRALQVFTDGLTDSIQGEDPANRLCDALADSSGRTMSVLKSLVDPAHNEDDVTILMVRRT